MADSGQVVAGDYVKATVSTSFGGSIVVQSGLKRRKLTNETVAGWECVDEQKVSRARGVATFGSSLLSGGELWPLTGQLFVVRLDWADGKRSTLKLQSDLYEHFALKLHQRRVGPSESSPSAADAELAPADVEDRLVMLAKMRSDGILTDEEFAAKKADLLRRI